MVTPIIKYYSMAGYEEYRTKNPDLLIDALWTQFTPLDAPQGGIHRLVPEPTLNIAISRFHNSQGQIHLDNLFIYGPISKTNTFELLHGHEIIAIRIKPEVCKLIFGYSSTDFTDRITLLDEVAPDISSLILEQYNDKLSAQQCLELLLNSASTISANKLHDSDYSNINYHALELIRKCNGNINQSKLANHFDLSSRQLRRNIKDLTGLTPKSFCRNIRFLKTLEYADQNRTVNWSDCAALFGFYDQAHMINEFQTLSNLTPAQLLSDRQAESVFSNNI